MTIISIPDQLVKLLVQAKHKVSTRYQDDNVIFLKPEASICQEMWQTRLVPMFESDVQIQTHKGIYHDHGGQSFFTLQPVINS